MGAGSETGARGVEESCSKRKAAAASLTSAARGLHSRGQLLRMQTFWQKRRLARSFQALVPLSEEDYRPSATARFLCYSLFRCSELLARLQGLMQPLLR